jgi:circadian clock protein KaiC
MKKHIQVLPSGIPLVDLAWGGFYRGGTYFLVGPRKSGRTLLALQYSLECARQKQTCLFFTSSRPKDLMINAASINVDLQQYMNQNMIVVVRVTPPKNIDKAKQPDSYLIEYIKDIKSIVNQYQPNKLVFDELTYFIGFKDLNKLKETFIETNEYVEDKGITSLYVLGEPATPASHKVVDTLIGSSTGYIQLLKKGDYLSKTEPGEMTIIPNVGHVEGQFSANYVIEPYKGIDVDYKPPLSAERESISESGKFYTSFSDIELPGNIIPISNLYSLSEFKLILNNQIAFYKSTGIAFTLTSIRMDEEAEKRGVLFVNQLKNAVRLSTEKKDKLCIVGNKVIILFVKEEKVDINNFIAKVINNLPSNHSHYRSTLIKYLSLYSAQVNKDVKHADDMLEHLFADEHPEQFRFGFQ